MWIFFQPFSGAYKKTKEKNLDWRLFFNFVEEHYTTYVDTIT